VRPAWYVHGEGGAREYVSLLHLPYTAWHLSYVVVGGCLAPGLGWGRLGLTVLAFFLAMGIGAHALDELCDRPLRTRIPSKALAGLAVASVAGAVAIGVVVAIDFSLVIVPLIAAGALLVPLYSLELVGGRLHTDLGFALAWGAFPVITGYVAVAGTVRAETFIAAAWAASLSYAQRGLSTPARSLRRHVAEVRGELVLRDGSTRPLHRDELLAVPESALRLLTASTVLVAVALVAMRASA
jgi:hypothetical protein